MPTDASLKERLAGRFLVLDGPDGCGKTTQQALLAERLRADGLAVTATRDPGGTAIGDRVRSVLLDHDLSRMDIRCETFLFMASRAQLCAEVIRPALAAGHVVVCDRFVSATCAYQGAAGFNVPTVIELARLATDDLWPDLTLLLNVDLETAAARLAQRLLFPLAEPGRHTAVVDRDVEMGVTAAVAGAGGPGAKPAGPDAMEARSRKFFEKVHRSFRSLDRVYPAPVTHVDGRGSPEAVYQRVLKAIRAWVE